MGEYITEITEGVLTLLKSNATLNDQASLNADEYFAFIFCVSYASFLRNYKNEYTGDYLLTGNTYYLNVNKQGPLHGYYISKHYSKLKNTNKGIVLKVRVNDSSKCVSLDE